jgi:hypothetical protein
MQDVEIAGIVAPFLVALGAFLKNQTPLKNDFIPLILVAVGLAAVMFYTRDFGNVATWIAAAMTGFTAVGIHSGTQATVRLTE